METSPIAPVIAVFVVLAERRSSATSISTVNGGVSLAGFGERI